jgi:outer membrane immunogenic protein
MKWLFAAGVLLGLTSAASAADVAIKAPPVVAPLYNWSGCYIGANVGGGWSQVSTFRNQIDTNPPTPAFLDYGGEDASGFLGGAQVGCDFQSTNLVFGLQGAFDWGDVKGSHNIVALPGFSEANSLRNLFPITGRVGYLWTPQLLGYLKLGFAWVNNKNQVFAPGGALFESTKFTDPLITAGIGAEYMFAPNWSVFAEANYYWSETDDQAHDYVTPAGIPNEVINNRQRIVTGLVGVNYKFHWDNGAVAKY